MAGRLPAVLAPSPCVSTGVALHRDKYMGLRLLRRNCIRDAIEATPCVCVRMDLNVAPGLQKGDDCQPREPAWMRWQMSFLASAWPRVFYRIK